MSAVDRVNEINDECPENGIPTPDQQAALISLADDLAQYAEALDGWIRGGGFLPSDWRKGRK
jgi:hypothetical protein